MIFRRRGPTSQKHYIWNDSAYTFLLNVGAPDMALT
jgi:hypothetical protein